jgi:lipopolysaccharide export system protein LptA
MVKIRGALIGAAALAFWAAAGILPSLAQNAASSSGFRLDGKEPIEIESDKLEIRDGDNIAIFTGNVTLIQGKLLLKTVKMTVYYANQSGGGGGPTAAGADIERMEAEGKVYLKQGEQVATGDYGTFDVAGGVMVLTGKEVVLSEGQNVVVGCKLTSHMNTGQSQLDGCGKTGEGSRVKMLLQPSSQNR